MAKLSLENDRQIMKKYNFSKENEMAISLLGILCRFFFDYIMKKYNFSKENEMAISLLGEEIKILQCEIKLDRETKQAEIDKLNKKLQEMESKFEVEIELKIEKIFAKLKFDEKRKQGELKNISDEQIRKMNERIMKLEKKREQQNQQIENKFVNANQERVNKEVKSEIEINENKINYEKFEWIIDKIDDKIKDAKKEINTTIFSDSFHTHKRGYTICLYAYPNGYDNDKNVHLSVGFSLMKGEFDDNLEWPFKHAVELSLINQQTGRAHVIVRAKYSSNFANDKDWDKPINERNFGIGFNNFIELKKLLGNADLIRNNQIVIKCSVNVTP